MYYTVLNISNTFPVETRMEENIAGDNIFLKGEVEERRKQSGGKETHMTFNISKFRLFLFLTIRYFFKTQNLIVNLNFPHCQ